RQMAAVARFAIVSGIDPLADKKAKRAALRKARTFGDFTDEFLESALAGFRNEKHKAQWKSTLDTYAASLRPMLLQDINTDDVFSVLKPIWHTKHETARRVRQRIERVLDAAAVKGLRAGDNPARWRGHLKELFGKFKADVRHHPAVKYDDMPD